MVRSNTRSRSAQLDWILLILLLPGLIGALYMGAQRYKQETSNRSVEMILDYQELQNLSAASAQPLPDILKRFKAAGVTGVAIAEDTVGDLTKNGQVSFVVNGPGTQLIVPDESLRARLWSALTSRGIAFEHGTVWAGGHVTVSFLGYIAEGGMNAQSSAPANGHVSSVGRASIPRVLASPATLNSVGIGLSQYAVDQVENSGLDVVARLQNYPSISKKGVDASLADLKKQHITRLISAADDVYGYLGLIPYVADKIKADNLAYGSIEFGKQKGDDKMCRELKANYIRVHSISNAEMATMTPASSVERFSRAVKERNIRLCYIRLPGTTGDDPVASGVDFVTGIRNGIGQVGYKPGIARPFDEIPTSNAALAMIALSIAAGTVLLLASVVSISSVLKYALLIVGFGGCAVFAMHGGQTKELVALLSAIVFPTLGVTLFIAPLFKQARDEERPGLKAAGIFLKTTAFSIFGGLMVMGLLAQRSYMLHLDQFMGVKLAHGFPLLAVAFMMVAGLPILGKPFTQVRREVSANLSKFFQNPLLVWHTIAVVAALGIIGIAVMRTGNDSGVGVSTLELKFRAILDHIMLVRPRTKEFLVGDPALILGIAFLLTRRRTWGLPLVAMGVIGQVSMLNSLCHIHTPLRITMMHEINGIWLGLVIGLIAWQLFGKQQKTAIPDKA